MPTIRELREAQNLSQSDLAVRSGVSTAAISRIENGRPVYRSTLVLLSMALKTDIAEISGVNLFDVKARAARRQQKRA